MQALYMQDLCTSSLKEVSTKDLWKRSRNSIFAQALRIFAGTLQQTS